MKKNCLIWKGRKNSKGYGVIRELGEILVHRWVYKLFHGEIPKNMYVCHKCDEPSCYNIEHLFLGTPQENTNDMIEKGRQALGKKLPHSKLTDEQVKEIFIDRYKGMALRDIAKKYNITKHTVYEIITHRKRSYTKDWFDDEFLNHIKKLPIDKTDQIGSKAHRAKLYEKDIKEIRKRFNSGEKILNLAEEFKVSDSTISDAIYFRTWKHVKEEEEA